MLRWLEFALDLTAAGIPIVIALANPDDGVGRLLINHWDMFVLAFAIAFFSGMVKGARGRH